KQITITVKGSEKLDTKTDNFKNNEQAELTRIEDAMKRGYKAISEALDDIILLQIAEEKGRFTNADKAMIVKVNKWFAANASATELALTNRDIGVIRDVLKKAKGAYEKNWLMVVSPQEGVAVTNTERPGRVFLRPGYFERSPQRQAAILLHEFT